MSATDPTVLLVEDDPLVRGFLADNLIADGFAVVSAESLGEGLRRLELAPPDVAVVDVGLPDGSGLELLGFVRGAAGAGTRVDPALPMLVLSGRAEELDRVRGFDRGADDYVVKPFSYPELRRRLEALLRRTRRPRAQRAAAGRRAGDRPGEPRRARGGRARGALAEGVRAAARAGRPAHARVHEGGAAARRLGLPLDGAHAHAGLARVPAADQARRRRAGTYVVNVWGVGYRLVDGRPGAEPARGAAA